MKLSNEMKKLFILALLPFHLLAKDIIHSDQCISRKELHQFYSQKRHENFKQSMEHMDDDLKPIDKTFYYYEGRMSAYTEMIKHIKKSTKEDFQ